MNRFKTPEKPQKAGAPNASGGLSQKRKHQEQSKQEENKKSAARAKPLLKTGTQKQVNRSPIAVIIRATDKTRKKTKKINIQALFGETDNEQEGSDEKTEVKHLLNDAVRLLQQN